MKSYRMMIAFVLAVALMMTGAALSEKASEPSRLAQGYREMILAEDYGDDVTYVIGHRHPDSDTVGSAIAYANFLNELGVKAEAVVAGPVNNETKYALELFGVDIPPVMENAEGKQFVLVDHSAYTHAIDDMPLARVVGVLDHHGIGSVQNPDFINVRSAPIGSTATLVYLAYRECEVPISPQMAKVMLMSLLSDTRNITGVTTAEMDRIAFEELAEISGIGDIDALYQGMQEAAANYDGMSDIDIYMTDYKEYTAGGVSFGVGEVQVSGEKAMAEMCDRMLAAMEENYEAIGLDMLFVKVNNLNEDGSENQAYMAAYPESARLLLDACFGNYDGRYFVFREKLSRKKTIVPALTAELEK